MSGKARPKINWRKIAITGLAYGGGPMAVNIVSQFLFCLLYSKSALFDGDFVIIGSQNLQWSAFGKDIGLSEYNLGVEDSGAAEKNQSFYDYLWDRAAKPDCNS